MKKSSRCLRNTLLALALAGLLSATGPVPCAHAWSFSIHRLINRQAVSNLPAAFSGFGQWAADLEARATEPDERKCCVDGESIRHYIDIDDYAEFHDGTLPHDFAAMKARYGENRVEENGIGPWALDEEYHRLVDLFRSGDWSGAVDVAGDIGHYAADLHQPLHLTVNFDGQLTGQNGIHSRFETRMTGRHLDEFRPLSGAAVRMLDPLETTFAWIDRQYRGVDRILNADRTARLAAAGSTSSDAYYDRLWEEIGQDTYYWIADSSMAVAALWYSAWIEAGSPVLPGTSPVEATTWSRIKSRF